MYFILINNKICAKSNKLNSVVNLTFVNKENVTLFYGFIENISLFLNLRKSNRIENSN